MTTTSTVGRRTVRWPTLIRSAVITTVFIAPARGVRLAGFHPNPVAALLIYAAAVDGQQLLLLNDPSSASAARCGERRRPG
jgi:hypothetical protein